MIRDIYLKDVKFQLMKDKKLADRAIAQVSDEQLLAAIDPESNSIAVVMKHVAGNMRSRWTDFLTADGEKPDRHRDQEFELAGSDTRESLLERWEDGWRLTLETIDALGWQDLEKTVTIRGEPHTVVEAINRQVAHYAYHVGQIVFLARHFAGTAWQSLSIPKGQSEAYNAAKARQADERS